MRLLTPIDAGPGVDAPGRASSSSWTSTSAVMPSESVALEQADQHVLLEGGHDEQDQVGAVGAGLPDLVGGDDEVLAQHRDVDGGANRGEVGEAAGEPALLGQDADDARAADLVVAGERRPGRR